MEQTLDLHDMGKPLPSSKVIRFLYPKQTTLALERFSRVLTQHLFATEDHAYAFNLNTPPSRIGWQRPLEAQKVVSEVLPQ
jgi:hypothetical protein